MSKYYITTTLPYLNSKPHIGFALEIIQADVLARYHRLLGDEVFFNTGTDEHGLKIYRKAQELGLEPQEYCDQIANEFKKLKDYLNLSFTNFIRTTDKHHEQAAQHFWNLCLENGDIYKKNYKVKYCVGCEAEKTDSELVDGRCPLHPNLDLELIEEENYFFRFSKYQDKLLNLYTSRRDFIVPNNRLKEIENFVKKGLQDFSISRLKSKMPWGVPVPNDETQVMYVWFDALINYLSALGWPDKKYLDWWPGIQVAGKDNLRQQSAIWQAMLMSAGLEPSHQIMIHGFITVNGQKMSKSLGNVVEPYDLVDKYNVDAVRYYLLGSIPSLDDGDFNWKKFNEFYTAYLVNGFGNLNSRILNMIFKYTGTKIPEISDNLNLIDWLNFWSRYDKLFKDYQLDKVVELLNKTVSQLDEIISKIKPWQKYKQGEDISNFLANLLENWRLLSLGFYPFIPKSVEKIWSIIGCETEIKNLDFRQWGKLKTGLEISKPEILFPRLNK